MKTRLKALRTKRFLSATIGLQVRMYLPRIHPSQAATISAYKGDTVDNERCAPRTLPLTPEWRISLSHAEERQCRSDWRYAAVKCSRIGDIIKATLCPRLGAFRLNYSHDFGNSAGRRRQVVSSREYRGFKNCATQTACAQLNASRQTVHQNHRDKGNLALMLKERQRERERERGDRCDFALMRSCLISHPRSGIRAELISAEVRARPPRDYLRRKPQLIATSPRSALSLLTWALSRLSRCLREIIERETRYWLMMILRNFANSDRWRVAW